MATKKETEQKPKVIEIPRPNRTTLKMKLRNIPGSTIIFNRLSEKAMEDIKRKQTQGAKLSKGAKNPEELFQASLHKIDGTYGFPGGGLKKAMVSAANIGDLKMTDMKKGFFIMGDLIPFTKCSEPHLREDFVRLPKGGIDWRIRAEIDEWEATVTVLFNSNFISPEQIINLADLAGFHIGLLEMRPFAPKSSGTHGMFEVVRD